MLRMSVIFLRIDMGYSIFHQLYYYLCFYSIDNKSRRIIPGETLNIQV